jgi:hypothetical protein
MYRILLLSLLALAGCQNVVGPFQRQDTGRVDDPILSIREQQQRGRDRYALPEDSSHVAPPILTNEPGPNGR